MNPPQLSVGSKRTGLLPWLVGALALVMFCAVMGVVIWARTAASSSSQSRPVDATENTVGRIEVGMELYLKAEPVNHIGRIKDIHMQHTFDDNSVRRGAYVEFKDGTGRWLPWEAIHKLYVTK